MAWSQPNSGIWPYPPVVLGGVAYGTGFVTSGGSASPEFTADSARTGAVLWTLKLPVPAQYGNGMAGSGLIMLLAVRSEPGGVIAIDTTARKILWRSAFPASTISGSGDDVPGVPVTDDTRVYVSGSSNALNVYSLTTGAKLWSRPITFAANGTETRFSTVAASDGVVYATTERGLVALDAASGWQFWTGATIDAYGQPVVAGGRVLVTTQAGVAAYPAAGCGRATCPATWTRAVAARQVNNTLVASADATSVFVEREVDATGTVECDMRTIGTLTRLSATTGAVQWSTKIGDSTISWSAAATPFGC